MNRTMPAVVNYAPEPNSVEIREVPVPEIGDNDVLLAVQAVGVCGTDIHLAYGQNSGKIKYPVILGHEFAGVIVQAGKNVRGFNEGDRVASETAAVIDENSPFVHRGLYNLDPGRRGFGFGVDGAMTHYAKVPERILHHIADTLPFELVVIGTGVDKHRLQVAEQIGATATLGANGEDVVTWTKSLRDGYGFDVVI